METLKTMIMKKLNKFFALILLILAANGLQAQQIPMYAAYTVNPMLISPSFTGDTETDARLFAINRLQFAGFDGAPVTFMFSADGPVRSQNMGLGGMVYTDKLGLLRQTGIGLNYAYRFNLGEDTRLHFGLGLNLNQSSLDFESIEANDMNENILNMAAANKVLFDGSFGMHLTYKDFVLGFAAPQVMGTRMIYKNYSSNTDATIEFQRHYKAVMSYEFPVKEGVFDLRPTVLMRTTSSIDPQFDINMMGIIKDNVFLSIGYRSDYAISFGGGVNVSDNLMVGYSFDKAVNDIAGASFGSHEFMLGYRYYKGVDRREMDKVVREEREKEREKLDDIYGKKIDNLENQLEEQGELNKLQREEIDKLRKIIESYGDELDSLKKANTNRFNRDLGEGGAIDVNGDGVIDEKDGIVRDDGGIVQPDGSVLMPDGTVVPAGSKGNPTTGGTSGARVGKYIVVVASFKEMNYAIEHQKMLVRKGDTDPTFILKSKSGTWYFVFKKSFNDPATAQKYLNDQETENLPEFMHPWIYVYE